MRWILVFILLYLIPLTVLFKNYKIFKRACIYGSIYIVLATTILISNMYLSGIRTIEETLDHENDLVLETYLDLYESNNVTQEKSSKCLDLQKIDEFKKDIYSIERVALIPMRDCLPYTHNLQKSISDLTRIKNDVVYAGEMCKSVVKVYDEMEVPMLSNEEYIKVLDAARLNVKKAYELRTLAMENSIMLIDTKNPIYINKINEYLKSSDREICSFKEKIEDLKLKINDK